MWSCVTASFWEYVSISALMASIPGLLPFFRLRQQLLKHFCCDGDDSNDLNDSYGAQKSYFYPKSEGPLMASAIIVM